MKIYEIYANDELWDETSCPFGTEVLTREAVDPLPMSELDEMELCEQLTAANLDYITSSDDLSVDMQWEEEDYNSSFYISTLTYVYDKYIYYVKMHRADGCDGYIMSREPRFNKKYL